MSAGAELDIRGKSRTLNITMNKQGTQDKYSSQWDWLRAEQEKEELHQCTFAPKVNESKKCNEAHTPLHRRLEELQRQRRSVNVSVHLLLHVSHSYRLCSCDRMSSACTYPFPKLIRVPVHMLPEGFSGRM